ncbi:MAG: DUF1460 domain-containing protein, partial [Bacteroidaceae bacterium]|nr:DUF1460 domain-containing protein [Bacteroidaceae bacterium]
MKNLKGILLTWSLLCAELVCCQTTQDSLRVCSLLTEGRRQASGTNLMLYYGHQFVGTPYVGGTLDKNQQERLVVNTREMDCTTFVETVVALTLTTCQGETSYKAFCQNLARIRYTDGILDGYASRNHYFCQWIASNERMGVVREVRGDKANGFHPFVGQQTLALHYMSQHPQAYPMLRDNAARQQAIATMERKASGA